MPVGGATIPAMTAAPIYFEDAGALARWLRANADTASELIVGFMKAGTGAPGLTWPQAVDEALCVGWIDGVRHRVDAHRYRIRFTPRRPGSHWSAVNIAKVEALQAAGRMTPAGLAAFAQRTEARSRRASYERGEVVFSAGQLHTFRQVPAAWRYFEACPPGYRKQLTCWVVSAKQDATQARRLMQLIEACAAGRRL
jgi:uncharacterized protein YdeI (YjbR/CyaY-like superfamily)